jgi:hypothetical protein
MPNYHYPGVTVFLSQRRSVTFGGITFWAPNSRAIDQVSSRRDRGNELFYIANSLRYATRDSPFSLKTNLQIIKHDFIKPLIYMFICENYLYPFCYYNRSF